MKATSLKLGAVMAALVVILAALQHGTAEPTSKEKSEPQDKDKTTTERADDERAIRASAEQFVKAFNAGDAKAAAAQFLEQAEYLNSDGESFEGREAIQKDLEEFFKEHPKAKIEIVIESIRFVGPRVAIEEGVSAVTREPDEAPVRQTYVAVDILEDGDWQLASVRETPDDDPATPHDHLEALAWLVGDWMDESDNGIAKTTCRWSEDGNYLLQDFQLEIAGRNVVSGQQRIGWDPLTERVRSWVFDSQGGYSEGIWISDEGRWIVKAHGVRPDGTVATATNTFTPIGQDSFLFESTSRTAGDEVEPDVRVVAVRRPPAAGAKDSKPDASKDAKPDAPKDAKPDAPKDTKPNATKDTKPNAAKDAKPDAAKEAKPKGDEKQPPKK